MGNLTKRIELFANVAIIVVAVILSLVLLKGYLFTNSPVPKPLSSVAEGQRQTGAKVMLPEMNWQKNGSTLLLALSTTCHFCTDSAPFYQRIIKDRGDTKLVALLPQTIDESKSYLQNLDVKLDEVKQVSLDTIGVAGTPTLILVNEDGNVKNVWVGLISPEQENEILNQINPLRASQ